MHRQRLDLVGKKAGQKGGELRWRKRAALIRIVIVRWRKGRACRATEKLSAVSTVQMPANRIPVIVNAVTPIVSDTQGMVTIVAIPCLSFPMLPCCDCVLWRLTPANVGSPGPAAAHLRAKKINLWSRPR